MLDLKKNFFLKSFLIFGLLLIFILIKDKCDTFFIVEYLKIKLSNLNNFKNIEVVVQFVNEFNGSKYCYLSVSERVLNENQYLFFTYFPRLQRIIFQQIFLVLFFATFFKLHINFKKNFFSKNYFMLTLIGFIFINYLSDIYIDFEYLNLKIIFLVASLFKSFLANIIVLSKNMEIKLLAILVFPLTSTGYGFPWLFDLAIYFLLFYIFYNYSIIKNYKFLILVVVTIIFSFLYPLIQTPSLETEIIDLPNDINYVKNFENLIDNVDYENQNNTYLEREDIREFRNNFDILQSSESEKFITDNVSNLKGVTYPDRWKFMVAIFPDFKYHLAPAIWYLFHIILFFDIFLKLKKDNLQYKAYISTLSNVLIYIPIISLVAGYSIFINSFSNLLFILSRNVEIVQFGKIQTWRGLSDHYEVFSNLQIFCFCLFALNFYSEPTKKNFFYVFIVSFTSLLPQSRWATLIYFVIFIFIFLYSKKYFIHFLIIFISSIFLLQILPTYDREDPFIFIDDVQIIEKIDNSDIEAIAKSKEVYFFEPISDRLNRTLPWKMFASGYKPDITSLSFGFGPGSYLNIIKNTNQDISSGPHSMILQVLNRFGILGLVTYFFGGFLLFNYSTKGFNKFVKLSVLVLFVSLQSLEFKTDSLMLTSGTSIFTLNLLLFLFFKHMHIKNLSSNKIKV